MGSKYNKIYPIILILEKYLLSCKSADEQKLCLRVDLLGPVRLRIPQVIEYLHYREECFFVVEVRKECIKFTA